MKNGKPRLGRRVILPHFLGRISARFERGTVFDSYLRQAERPRSTKAHDQVKRVAWSLPATCANVLLVGALLFSGYASAQEVTDEIPDHATTARYGGGWDCDRGYRETNDSCTAVEPPANAYATNSAFGVGWECRRGHRKLDESCVAIDLPTNGYLSAGRGDAWKCARGFRKTGESCISIEVPANGYLSASSYGTGWECERGYQAVDETCFAFVVPANAHVNFSGKDWDCDRPYRKSQHTCELH